MKRLLMIMLSVLMLSACGTGEEEDEMENDFENAPGVTWLSNGWNLGNTLDACSYGSKTNKGLYTETSWNMPETTQAMINAVATQGFKSIRVPVSWHNHITDSNYTIDSEWMARVKEIVNWSLDAGLKVIINIHHDNLTESQMNSTYGFCVPENNTSLKNQSKAYITEVWKQISATFKDYDARLVFELLNEPRCRDASNDGFTAPSNLSACNSVITQYEQAALDVIRASGGNNASRYVMVPPYAASPDQTSGWSLPTDSASGKLIVSLHAYTPYEFCMKDMSVTSFGSSQKGSLDWLFTSINTNYISKGIHVVIGEMSSSDKNNTSERKKWFTHYCEKAKALGIPLVLWDNMSTISNGGTDPAERHGYFNRKNLTWYFPELVNVMVGK